MARRDHERAHDALRAMRACVAKLDDAESRAWGERTLHGTEQPLSA